MERERLNAVLKGNESPSDRLWEPFLDYIPLTEKGVEPSWWPLEGRLFMTVSLCAPTVFILVFILPHILDYLVCAYS